MSEMNDASARILVGRAGDFDVPQTTLNSLRNVQVTVHRLWSPQFTNIWQALVEPTVPTLQ